MSDHQLHVEHDIPDDLAFTSEERYRLLVDSIEDYAIYMLDRFGHVMTWNHGAQVNKGYQSHEIIGRHFQLFFAPEDVATHVPAAKLAEASANGRCVGEGWRVRKNGERFWASYVLTAMRGPGGNLIGFSKVVRDITPRKRQEDAMLAMESALREERDRLHAAAESSMDALYICQAVRGPSGEIEDFLFTYLNSNVEKMVSLPRSLLLGQKMCQLLPINRTLGLFDMYRQVVLTGRSLEHEFFVEDKDIKSSWIRVQAVKLRDGIAITAADITERKQNEERIVHLAQHDVLTGLPNRLLMEDRIRQAMAFAKRNNNMTAVFLIDLDSFKQINDTLGHGAGDVVLKETAARLQAAMRGTDTVIRLGGDEFVAVLPGMPDRSDIRKRADKILAAVTENIQVAGRSVQITCSIGCAIYPEILTMDKLLSCADFAMYAAKRRGKNQLEIFSADTEPLEP